MQKQHQKPYHDHNIKRKDISVDELVLLYYNRIKGKPKTLHTSSLGPYIAEELNNNGTVQLKTLQGQVFTKSVNITRLKEYKM